MNVFLNLLPLLPLPLSFISSLPAQCLASLLPHSLSLSIRHVTGAEAGEAHQALTICLFKVFRSARAAAGIFPHFSFRLYLVVFVSPPFDYNLTHLLILALCFLSFAGTWAGQIGTRLLATSRLDIQTLRDY